jgi:GTP pyrophosphokinase
MGQIKVDGSKFKYEVNVWEIAEKGYAAHYKYKNGATEESGLDVVKLKEALENSETSAVDFVEDFKMNLYSKEIYIYLKGYYITPKGATSLDFASIHLKLKKHEVPK